MWSAIPPGPTGWDWRGSPKTHRLPPGQASTAASTPRATRRPLCGTRRYSAPHLVTLARAFDVPVLYFLTPPPAGIFVHVPGSRIDTLTMLDAVLGRPDNLSEWETLLDEWTFTPNEELPFPLSETRRQQIRAMAGEIALIRAHHLIRKHFKGSLPELQDALRSLADLVFDVEKHDILANLDEDEHVRRLEAMRANIAKGNRIADTNKQLEGGVAEHEQAQGKAGRKRTCIHES